MVVPLLFVGAGGGSLYRLRILQFPICRDRLISGYSLQESSQRLKVIPI